MMTGEISNDFRGAMRRLTTTVSVIASSMDGDWYGMTATAVTSVCAEPAALLVCINASSSLQSPVLASGRFCVNMLQVDQQDISTAFAGRLKGQGRFQAGDWHQSRTACPISRTHRQVCFALLNRRCRSGHTISLSVRSIVS